MKIGFETKLYLPSIEIQNYGYKSVSSGTDLYIVGHYDGKSYSYSSKIWNNLPELPYSHYFCIWSFMQELFVLKRKSQIYDFDSNFPPSIKEFRRKAGWTLFEGIIKQ